MSPLTVVYDACVLYPAPLRSFLMHLAMTGLYRARWSMDIHAEWMRNVRQNYPDITQRQVKRIRDLMDAHVLDCVVTGYESLIPSITLPDPDDRHVLAAAIHCGANVILTFNLRDFPDSVLNGFGIIAQHPDDFIRDQISVAPDIVCAAAKEQRESLRNPPKSVDEYLASLERQGLPQTIAALRQFAPLI